MPDTFEVLTQNNEEIQQLLAELQQGAGPPHPGPSELSARRPLVDRLVAMASRQEAAAERLLPAAVRGLGPDAARIVGQAIGQSQMITRILARLAAADADPEAAGRVSATVAAAWCEHIDFQEQQVLPLLRQVGQAAAAAQAEAGGSREPVVAALDRLRDAAASRDASGPFTVPGGQASGCG